MYLAFAAACDKSPEIEKRTVALHVPAACPIDGVVYGTYQARGDFQPTTASPAEDTVLLKEGVILDHLPAYARALFVDVRKDDNEWLASAEIPPTGNVDLLLWPDLDPCALSRTIPLVDGAAIAAISSRYSLIVGGGLTFGENRFPQSFIVDFGTGKVAPMLHGPTSSRARASLTRFGSGALLAGGVRSDDPSVLDTAETWNGGTGDFDAERIQLSRKRVDHGAVELATGETLLVAGATDTGQPLGTMERVSPADRRASEVDLPPVEKRRSPFVARLATGEILIAGGVDGVGAPIGSIEILSPDAKQKRGSSTLFVPSPKRQAWVPLSGGGALGVVEHTTPGNVVWRISADNTLKQVGTIPFPLGDFRLFPSTCGTALLWTGTEWQYFNPWDDRFHVANAQSSGPSTGPSWAPEASMTMWLSKEGSEQRLIGRRFSVRNAFSSEVNPALPLALCSLASFIPEIRPLAPDRSPLAAGMSIDGGQVVLPDATSVFVTDATYADFTLDLDVVSGDAPLVVLRTPQSTFTIGGADCVLPAGMTVHVERTGVAVSVRSDGTTRWCNHPAPSDRVSVGFTGRGSTFRNIRLVRRPGLP